MCFAPEAKVCSLYFRSAQVFVGKVERVEYLRPRGEYEEGVIEYRVRVEQVFRGKPEGKAVILHSGNHSGRWPARPGHRYLVFTDPDGNVGGTCGPADGSGFLAQGVREIRALQAATSSTIEGSAMARGTDQRLRYLAGKTIKAIGAGAEYLTTTDTEGGFRLTVPPGRYRLELQGLYLWELSWLQDLENIDLQAGQCAQAQLIDSWVESTRLGLP